MTELTRDERVKAFRVGFLHGRSNGKVTPNQAEYILREYTTIPVTPEAIDVCCNGAEDGASGDTWRNLRLETETR